MRTREPDACTADEYHGLLVALDKLRLGPGRNLATVRVDRVALDHLLKDHARLQREKRET